MVSGISSGAYAANVSVMKKTLDISKETGAMIIKLIEQSAVIAGAGAKAASGKVATGIDIYA